MNNRPPLGKRTNLVNNIHRTSSDITSYKNPLNTHPPIISTGTDTNTNNNHNDRHNTNNHHYPLNNNPHHLSNIHKRKLPSNLTTSILPSLSPILPDSEDVLASHVLTELTQKKVKPSDIILSQPMEKTRQNTVTLTNIDENTEDFFYCNELLPIELLYPNELTDNAAAATAVTYNNNNNININNSHIDIPLLLDNLLSKCYSLTNINISDQNYQTALKASYDAALNCIDQLQLKNDKLNKQVEQLNEKLNQYNTSNTPIMNMDTSEESSVVKPSPFRESQLEAQIEQLRKELSSTNNQLSHSAASNLSLTRNHFNAISLLTSSYHHQFKSAEEQREKFKNLYEIRLEQFKQTLQNNDYNYQKQLKKLTNNSSLLETENASLKQQLEARQKTQKTSGRTYSTQ